MVRWCKVQWRADASRSKPDLGMYTFACGHVGRCPAWDPALVPAEKAIDASMAHTLQSERVCSRLQQLWRLGSRLRGEVVGGYTQDERRASSDDRALGQRVKGKRAGTA